MEKRREKQNMLATIHKMKECLFGKVLCGFMLLVCIVACGANKDYYSDALNLIEEEKYDEAIKVKANIEDEAKQRQIQQIVDHLYYQKMEQYTVEFGNISSELVDILHGNSSMSEADYVAQKKETFKKCHEMLSAMPRDILGKELSEIYSQFEYTLGVIEDNLPLIAKAAYAGSGLDDNLKSKIQSIIESLSELGEKEAKETTYIKGLNHLEEGIFERFGLVEV